MYEQLLADAGYEPTVNLVDSRDGYMPTFPGDVDVVPEYVGGIVNFLNAQANGADAEPFEAGDGGELADAGADLLTDAGITLLDLSAATDTNAFFVTQEYSEENGVTKLSDLEGVSVTLAAAPDCEGRLDCEGGLSERVRHRRHRGAAARLRQRPDLPVGARRRVRARRDQHHRRHPGVPGPRRARGRQGDPAGPEPRARRSAPSSSMPARASPTCSTR